MLGVLSVLLLLIPSLMLMAQVTRYAQITVFTPKFSKLEEGPRVISCGRGPPVLEVAIAHDGFYTRTGGMPWERVGAPIDGHDHDSLAAVVKDYKRSYPHETTAMVSAEADIHYETLVATLDTVRGRDCRLAEALTTGEDIPSECLLWQPQIRDHDVDLHAPAFRGGGTWPPRGPRTVNDHDHAESLEPAPAPNRGPGDPA